MRIKRITTIQLVLSLIIVITFTVGCAGSPSTSTPSSPSSVPAPPTDVPSLSSQDVISIAQEHSVNSPLNAYEGRAGAYARRGGTQGWIADYTGNGKWIVELLVRNEDESLTVYRWTVVEANLAALFLGAYTGSLIE